MAGETSNSASRLCIFHRRLEPAKQPCPWIQGRDTPSGNTAISPFELVTPLSYEDATLLETLQTQPSALCQRCSDYDVIGAFKEAEILDQTEQLAHGHEAYIEYQQYIARYEIRLGLLSSLHLTPSCQLCRLIYRILPRGSLDPADTTVKIVPFKPYIRRAGWENTPSDLRSGSAIFLGIDTPDYTIAAAHSLTASDDPIRLPSMAGEAVALSSQQTFPGRKWYNARFVDRFVDFATVKMAIEHCESSHGQTCHISEWPAEMATVRMVDVVDRRIVPCPDRCDYVALSYVWGGVMPMAGALDSRTLPRTIEDAITATGRLGRRYLWVDALCIDQGESLSAEKAAAKQEQLGLMHLIYRCATITIVALAGDNSDAGLAGVSHEFPRIPQSREIIHGHDFFTVPPTIPIVLDTTVWQSRAWTLQEGFCTRRSLYLSETQAQFECGQLGVSESEDLETWPHRVISRHPSISTFNEFFYGEGPLPGSVPSTPGHLRVFGGMLSTFTSRRMTNESDSLNAFLGVLAMMEKFSFPSGFTWGLPLQSHPQSLAWTHDRRASRKRRAAFPSWSWAGWEGKAMFPDTILELESDYRQLDPRKDLKVRLVAVDGKDILVEGWTVTLDIRTEPFSEAFRVGSKEVIGSVREGNSIHNNTVPSGTYSGLVVERVSYKIGENVPEKQEVFLLLLDWVGTVANRMTLVKVTPFLGGDFMLAEPQKTTVRLC